MSGLTSTGFLRKRLDQIKSEIEEELKALLGNYINITPPSVFSQIIGVIAEREDDLWELAENVYNSQYPDTAEGVSLDNVVAFNGITRQGATSSRIQNQHLFGTSGTLVPAGTQVSVNGNPDARFLTDFDVTLGDGQDQIQRLEFSDLPVAGSFKLILGAETTESIPSSADAAALQTILRELDQLSEVSVSGSFATGFDITFEGEDGKIDFPLLVVSENSLVNGSSDPVDVTLSITQTGIPQGLVDMTAETEGEVQAPARTLTVIETPVSGLDRTMNLTDAVVGRNVETDAELRERRQNTLQVAGAGTPEAIRSALLNIDGVSTALVFENDDDVEDVAGRPPHSFEAVVDGGEDQDIWDAIWASKPAGIRPYGSEIGTVIDSEGQSQTVAFSRPTAVPIYVQINVNVGPNFPVNGAALLRQAVIDKGNAFGIGMDVIVVPDLIYAAQGIPGILDLEILVSKTPGPTLEDNIDILANELAVFDSSTTGILVT